MKVDVFLTGQSVQPGDVANRTAIVLDVFRASSTIITALQHRARSVVPVAEIGDASELSRQLDPSTFVLGGERGGIKVEHFHLGNSPLEYTPEAVSGKTVILTTTNGTLALSRARTATHLIVGGFLNAKAALAFAQEQDLPLAIICAGWRGKFSLEDTLCAGRLLDELWQHTPPSDASDTARAVHTLYQHDKDALTDVLTRSNHGQRLVGLGHSDDVAYCLEKDTVPVVPVFRESRLILAD